LNFIYDKSIPVETLGAIKDHLEPLAWLVPGWCQKVHVEWCSEGGENTACIDECTEYEYRRISLRFYSEWLYGDADLRREQVTHELIHAFSGPLYDYVYDTIERLLPESDAPKFREHAIAELKVRNESFVQDMAFCLHRHLKEHDAKKTRK
jgi:hypothetical protein